MRPYNTSLASAFLLFTMTMALLSGCSATQEHGHEAHDNVLPQYVFAPVNDIDQQIDDTLSKASEQNKLAMIVLGAQWCHDSRGLAANFSKPAMQKILQEKYVTLFVDVGFLKDRRNITERFGYPAYFATPTVLIVNPQSKELLNQSSMEIWQAADSVELTDYQKHFSDLSSFKPTKINKQHPSFTMLNQFTKFQVERLHKGYAVLGPMLQADVEGKTTDKSALRQLWADVRNFRMTLQRDIHALQAQLASSPNASVELPTYPKQSWE